MTVVEPELWGRRSPLGDRLVQAGTQRERKNLERQVGQHSPGDQLTSDQVKALVNALRDIVSVLAAADPADKTERYDQLGVSLTYNADGTVTVESRSRGKPWCRRGTRTVTPRSLGNGRYPVAA